MEHGLIPKKIHIMEGFGMIFFLDLSIDLSKKGLWICRQYNKKLLDPQDHIFEIKIYLFFHEFNIHEKQYGPPRNVEDHNNPIHSQLCS